MQRRVYDGAICESGGTYGIIFPDFPGCVSAGDSWEEVIAMGHEALDLHVSGMVDDGDELPEPKRYTLEQVKRDFAEDVEDCDDEWVAVAPILVAVPELDEPRPVELDPELLRRVRTVQPNAVRFISEAALRELDRLQKSA